MPAGRPFEFPVMSLGETNLRPTSMLFRNLASMDVEESIRANPMDGVILLVGCDKTTPALLMGASSCDLPTLCVSGGPMLNGHYRNQLIGSGTAVWQFSEEVRGGRMSLAEFQEAEGAMSRSPGHCMTMGTASTMASMVESLGVGLPHNAAIPAVDSRRNLLARLAGRRIVEMVREDLKLSKILTKQAFENAIRVNGAIGGSTNAVIHLLAIAGRVGVDLSLDDWDRMGRGVPTIVDLMPSGRFLMEDFYYAGGLPAVIRRLGEAGLLHKDALTANGNTIWQNNKDAPCWNDEVIRPFEKALTAGGRHRRAARQSGAPGRRAEALGRHAGADGPSRPRRRLRQHRAFQGAGGRSRARYRRDLRHGAEELRAQGLSRHRRGRQHAAAREDPEEGHHRHGPHLRCADERDRLWHGRAPCRAGSRGRRAARHRADGDMIELDVPKRSLKLLVDDGEIERRLKDWKAPALPGGGYKKLYVSHVNQADQGCDLDFLVGCRGAEVPRESH